MPTVLKTHDLVSLVNTSLVDVRTMYTIYGPQGACTYVQLKECACTRMHGSDMYS